MADVKQIFIDKVASLGSATASMLYPYDFECYSISFELVNGLGKTIDYMSFPIMPQGLQIDESPAVNIRSTFGGISAVSSELYTPKTITLRGNFGRNIRFVARDTNAVGNLVSVATSFVSQNQFERAYSKS